MPRSADDAGFVAAMAERLRALLPATGVREQRMFGGIAFMLNEHMTVAVSKRGLLVRVGKDGYAEAVERPGAAPMIMRGGPVEGYVNVETEGLDAAALAAWVDEAVAFVRTLPAKAPRRG